MLCVPREGLLGHTTIFVLYMSWLFFLCVNMSSTSCSPFCIFMYLPYFVDPPPKPHVSLSAYCFIMQSYPCKVFFFNILLVDFLLETVKQNMFHFYHCSSFFFSLFCPSLKQKLSKLTGLT